MENMTAALAATDEQLIEAADVASVDTTETDAPAIVLGEPCDV
jgi:hypothetical protein